MNKIEQALENLNEVDRYIVLLLRAGNNSTIPGGLWLQKEIFILKELFPVLERETDYGTYFMGPHSEIVEQEVEELAESNLVQQKFGKISLTDFGKKVASELSKKWDKHELDKITEFKEFLNDLSKDELLAFIYFSFMDEEELKQESIAYPAISKNRKKLAISLYKKEKVSFEKAAQIAGISVSEFMDEIKMVV